MTTLEVEQVKAKIVADYYAEFPKGSAGAAGGPKTEAGKQRTRLNAYKHGLTGEIHLFTPEEQQAFDAHCKNIVEALGPVGNLEQQVAQLIAEGHWRLNRAHAIESGIFALGQITDESEQIDGPEIDHPELAQPLSQARTWLDDGRQIQLLSLYEQRIQRSIARHMAELRALQAVRLAARQQAVEEAILLSQLAKTKGETYDLAADLASQKFVFSTSEIEHLMARQQRLAEARALPKTSINPNPARQMPAAA